QVLNFSPLFSLPNFQTPALRYVASGWKLSTIYRYQTGGYIDIVAGGSNDFARNGTNVNAQRAVYLGGDPIGDHSGRPLTFWLNKDAFTTPAVGTMGNTGTRSVVGPSHFDFNMSLSRTFRVRESQRVEFRWEVYNVTNSFRPFNPNFVAASAAAPTTQGAAATADVTNRLFGQIRNSDDPRIMQFALKYLF